MGQRRRVHLRIRGRVQGVFFRATARTMATRLSLAGWVRNCPDGTVEAIVEGPVAAVEEFIGWCHQGPPSAVVNRVEIELLPSEPVGADLAGTGFEIRF